MTGSLSTLQRNQRGAHSSTRRIPPASGELRHARPSADRASAQPCGRDRAPRPDAPGPRGGTADLTATLPGTPEAVGLARRLAREALTGCPRVDDLVLAV